MPSCRHCSHDVGYDASFCPSCGERDPARDWSIRDSTTTSGPESPEWLMNVGAAIGGVIGLIYVGYFGFHVGGIGGAILFGLVGGVVCGVIGYLVGMMLVPVALWALLWGAVALVVWLFFHFLWGAGKPP